MFSTDDVKLNVDDAALVLRGDGNFELHIPALEDDAIVSATVITLSALAFLIGDNDPKFMEILNKKIDEITKQCASDVE